MEKVDTGSVIYSITIGDNPLNGIKWTLGQKIRLKKKNEKTEQDVIVSNIMFDESFYFHNKENRYAIFVKEEGGNEILWKTVSNRNIYLAYDI